jgi:RHS repeat-associated protein
LAYGENGDAIGFTVKDYEGIEPRTYTYYYIKNAQGDVLRVVDETGATMADYTYDAWGSFTFTPGANAGANAGIIEKYNPVTYRGYYYDTDLEMYYLKSRYYNPRWGRFLSADKSDVLLFNQGNIIQHNMYAYCLNNPVNLIDPTGYIGIITCVLIGAGIGLFLGAGAGTYISYREFNEVRWKYVLIGAVAGAAIGATAGYAIGIAIGASSTTIITAKKFAGIFKIPAKISKQMAKRGWTNQLIKDTILKNVGRKAFNKATGNAATAYFTSSGAYIVIDNITKQIVQISDRLDTGWVVDATIKLLKGDVFIR